MDEYRESLRMDEYNLSQSMEDFNISHSMMIVDQTVIHTADNRTTEAYPVPAGFDIVFVLVTSLILGVLIIMTIIGNVFVIGAILLDRHLQSVANYLILSLAVADLLVALLVMPLGAVYMIRKTWSLGPVLCDMWTCSDVLCCTASILHLLAIAVDRFWAVTRAEYIHSRNSQNISLMICLVWVISIIVSLAPLLGWKDDSWAERVEAGDCMVSQDISYQIFATSATFFVPLILILILYWRIFLTARGRLRRRMQQKAEYSVAKHLPTVSPPNTNIRSIPHQLREHFNTNTRSIQHQAPKGKFETTSFISAEKSSNDSTSAGEPSDPKPSGGSSGGPGDIPAACNHHNNHDHSGAKLSVRTDIGCQTDTSRPLPPPPAVKLADEDKQKRKKGKKHVSLEAKREKKAAKTLAIVTGAFILCWLPFFVMALVTPLCKNCIDQKIFSFFLWLGYFNSTLNPIIYTVFSPEFRQAFKKLLCNKNSHESYRPRHLQ